MAHLKPLLFGIVVLLLLGCLGFDFPIVLIGYTLFGWIGFLWNVLPRVTVSVPMAVYSVVACGALVVGSHWFLRWLYQSLAAPPVDNATTSEATAPLNRQWRLRWTLQAIGLVLVMFIAGISIVGVTHQFVWLATSEERLFGYASRDAARRNASMNKLRQQGLGIESYSNNHQSIPPGFTADPNGRMLHSWQTMILPSVEEFNLYKQIDLTQPWNSPRNAPHCRQEVDMFINPSVASGDLADAEGFAVSHYAGNKLVLGSAQSLTFRDIADGNSRTVMAGEAAGNFVPWAKPTQGRDLQLGLNKSPDGFGSERRAGKTLFLMADGSVKEIVDGIDPRVLAALATPNGGEDVSVPPY